MEIDRKSHEHEKYLFNLKELYIENICHIDICTRVLNEINNIQF